MKNKTFPKINPNTSFKAKINIKHKTRSYSFGETQSSTTIHHTGVNKLNNRFVLSKCAEARTVQSAISRISAHANFLFFMLLNCLEVRSLFHKCFLWLVYLVGK